MKVLVSLFATNVQQLGSLFQQIIPVIILYAVAIYCV